MDWAYATAGISFSYSISLRDTGTVGLVSLPSSLNATALPMIYANSTVSYSLRLISGLWEKKTLH